MSPSRARTALLLAGVFLVAAYLAATARIPLYEHFPGPGVSVSFVEVFAPDWERATVQYVALVTLTFGAYLGAVAVVWRGWYRPSRWLIFGFAALFALALLPMYPPTAMDMFHYHAMARIAWIFHANPLTTPQSAYPYPIGMSWAELASPYGPLWSLITGPAAVLPPDVVSGLYAFKLMGVASYLGCTALIWAIVRRSLPGQQALAAVLFAWNPFVVLRVVGDGHNDLWMMLPVLAALWCAQRGWWVLAIEALTLSVLIKFATALLGPPLLLYVWTHAAGDRRSRAWLLARAGALSLATAVLAYAPFFDGLATFEGVRLQTALTITSTPLLIEIWLRQIGAFGWDDPMAAAETARQFARLIFLALYPAMVWDARRDFSRLVTLCFAILFLYLLVAASWYRPWYMLWPVTLAALRPRSWLGPTLLTATFFGALPDLIEQYRIYWPWIEEYHRALAAPVVVAFVPPFLVWLWGLVRTGGWSIDTRGGPRGERG